MKSVFLLLFFYLSSAEAHTFYFSSSDGNDHRTVKEAQNPATPWKSLDKLNSYYSSLSPGDSVLLKRGDEFYGTINITSSGTKDLPITISAFGTGAKPIISGFSKISKWVARGNGIWESEAAVTNLSTLNIVVIGDEIQQIGRFPNANSPNKGYLKIVAHSGKNSITDANLTSTPNWNGGDIVIKTSQYSIDRAKIVSHSGGVIIFGNGLTYEPNDGWGYFIQNHPATLDNVGEWYFNPESKKLQIFYGKIFPPIVKIATLNNLLIAMNINFTVVNNLNFVGANENTIKIKGPGTNFTLQNCDIAYSGIDGIFSRTETNLDIENCNVSNTLNEGISVSDNSIVRKCMILNTGCIAGMTQNNAGISAIINSGNGSVTEYNVIKRTGYIGIKFGWVNSLIKNNLIDSFCLIKQDGGGIYSEGKKNEIYSGTKIIGNIVLNGVGSPEGSNTKNNNSVGIYCDDFLNNIEISGNTVANAGVGIFLHNDVNIILKNNTSYNNSRSQLQITRDKKDFEINGIILNNNIFFSKTPDQIVSNLTSVENDFEKFGSMNNNFYTRPILESGNIFQKKIGKKMATNYSLESSQSTYPLLERESKKFPVSIKDTSKIRFEYNPTSGIVNIELRGTYIDAEGSKYSGSLKIGPYSSFILIKIK